MFFFESSQFFGLKLRFMRKALVLHASCYLQQQGFLSCCFLQLGKVRNFWWGTWGDLRAGWQDILFLSIAACRARTMIRIASKATLLEPDCPVFSG